MKSSKGFQTVDARIWPESADDEIVISGISGKFPKARNMAEFEHKLYNKVKWTTSRDFLRRICEVMCARNQMQMMV